MKLIKILSMFLLTLVLPIQAFAHGEEDMAQSGEIGLLNYAPIILGILFVVTLSLWFVSNKKIKKLTGKTKEERLSKEKLTKFGKVYLWVGIFSFTFAVITGVISLSEGSESNTEITLTHIHGLGYTPDGKELYIPAHDGLRVYHDGHWAIPEGEQHDYMGFSMVDFGFYSSGHPGPGSDLENPFGVIKSKDMGQTLEILDSDLYKVIDFHGMAAGYESHAIYVLNPQPNSRMDETGLHYTLDETKTWNKSAMKNLEGQPASIAVHPTQENIVAIGTNLGLYVSEDYGDTFSNMISNAPTTAVHFNHNGDILAGTVSNEEGFMVNLYQISRDTGEKEEVIIPQLQEEDAISFIAANPTNVHEITFSTFKRDVFITRNHGQAWELIAENGTGISMNSDEDEVKSHQGHGSSDGDGDHGSHDAHHDHGMGNKEKILLDVTWNFNEEPKGNNQQDLEIKIMDQEGSLIENFDVEHEKLMHLIVVSKDLSVFQHLHPEYEGNGVFKVATQFPKGGEYKLIADIVPSGYAATTVTEWINVNGREKEEELVVDENMQKLIDNKEISLEFDQLEVGTEELLVFHLQDATTEEPITNIQPYLGAIGHVVIVSEDGEEYLHSHPINNDESGPEAKFMTTFPKAGIYKIWGQFMIDNEIVTAPFVVNVP